MDALVMCQRCQKPLVEAPVEYLKASAKLIYPNMPLPREWKRQMGWVQVCQNCDFPLLTFDFNFSMPLRLPSGEIIESATYYRRWDLNQPTEDIS